MKKTIPYFLLFLLLLLLLFWISLPFSAQKTYSDDERRILQAFPQLEAAQLANASYPDLLERALKDHFPLRELWRNLDTTSSIYLFGHLQHRGYAISRHHILKLSYAIDQASVQHAANHMAAIHQRYLSDTDCSLFLCVIPEKNYYLLDFPYPSLDPQLFLAQIKATLPGLTVIPLVKQLNLSSYYQTDPHWKQEMLRPVANQLLSFLCPEEIVPSVTYTQKIADSSFHGAYSGGAGWMFLQDSILYLKTPQLDSVEVVNPVSGQSVPLYDHSALLGRDPYTFFLLGNQPILTMTNPNSSTNRQLIIFRDSFASPLAPLLLVTYRQITLIDTRYLSISSIQDYVSFQEQDVLFLYSTLLLNDSATLKNDSLLH